MVNIKDQINYLRSLVAVYGGDVDLDTIIEYVESDKPHECKACCGTGKKITINRQSSIPNTFYSNIQQSNIIEVCKYCNGEGRTKTALVPRMVQDGWTKS